ncbi:AfsR/SARP family transcriptional regulator [Geodermatophilus sp. FMUSA9-8]|uniref:AfsR/SARP family transcriptional regulator n=1 Tax=Geodermatophilus sp. FMUSA9-8 TaxID=3120155 RepID=UPI00300B9445
MRDLPRAIQRLVAHLALSRCPHRDAVAGALWPDVPEEHAHGSLRSALWRLRRLAPGMVETPGDSLRLGADVRVDVRELETWASRVLDLRVRGGDVVVPEEALRGELLPGWHEDWVALERERVRQLRVHALEAVADELIRIGRPGAAAEAARAAARGHPLRESAHRVLVRAHLAAGEVAEARRAYESFREALADTLGIAPTPSMTALLTDPRLFDGRPAPGPDVLREVPGAGHGSG